MRSLFETPVITLTHLCQAGPFLRWRRVHHRPRIQKKWRRFGAIYKPCTGYGYEVRGPCGPQIVGCPCFIVMLKKALGAKGTAG